jgi:hypothetical protein
MQIVSVGGAYGARTAARARAVTEATTSAPLAKPPWSRCPGHGSSAGSSPASRVRPAESSTPATWRNPWPTRPVNGTSTTPRCCRDDPRTAGKHKAARPDGAQVGLTHLLFCFGQTPELVTTVRLCPQGTGSSAGLLRQFSGVSATSAVLVEALFEFIARHTRDLLQPFVNTFRRSNMSP